MYMYVTQTILQGISSDLRIFCSVDNNCKISQRKILQKIIKLVTRLLPLLFTIATELL
jgi:hypothetical protein